jgi:hypothetical protein
MAIKYTNIPTSSIARPSKICRNWDLWFEIIPSGNPVQNEVEAIFFALNFDESQLSKLAEHLSLADVVHALRQ